MKSGCQDGYQVIGRPRPSLRCVREDQNQSRRRLESGTLTRAHSKFSNPIFETTLPILVPSVAVC